MSRIVTVSLLLCAAALLSGVEARAQCSQGGGGQRGGGRQGGGPQGGGLQSSFLPNQFARSPNQFTNFGQQAMLQQQLQRAYLQMGMQQQVAVRAQQASVTRQRRLAAVQARRELKSRQQELQNQDTGAPAAALARNR